MGLYDTVTLDESHHLPDYPGGIPPPDSGPWQTKGIDRPCMNTFRITADGRLYEEEWHAVEVPPEERPYASRDDVEPGDFRYMLGSLSRIHDGWIPREDYHGRFQISRSFDQLDSLLRYEVTFTHGRLEGFEWID